MIPPDISQGNPADLLNVRPTNNGENQEGSAADEAMPILRGQEVGDRLLDGGVCEQGLPSHRATVPGIGRLESAYPVEPPLDPREVSILTEAASLLRLRGCHASAVIVMEELNWLAGRLNPDPKSREPVDKDRQTWDAIERWRREQRQKHAVCTSRPATYGADGAVGPELGGEGG